MIRRGFSTIYFVEQRGSKKKFAVKKIVCHGAEDENLALQEIEYHKMLDHPNILPCLDYAVITKNVELLQSNVTIVYMLLPLYDVRTCVLLLSFPSQFCINHKTFRFLRPTAWNFGKQLENERKNEVTI